MCYTTISPLMWKCNLLFSLYILVVNRLHSDLLYEILYFDNIKQLTDSDEITKIIDRVNKI